MDTIFLEGPPATDLDDAVALADGGALVLSVLGVHTQDFTSGDFSLSAEDLFTSFDYAVRAKRIRLTGKAQCGFRLLPRFEKRLIGPLRDK